MSDSPQFLLSRFGDVVFRRRSELRLTHTAVRSRGGPSGPTLTRIERGQPPPPSSAVLDRLDVALEWQPGSARRVLRGGNATDQTDFGPGVVPLPIGDLTQLLETVSALRSHLDAIGPRADPQREIVEALVHVTESVIGPIASGLVTKLLAESQSEPETFGALATLLSEKLDATPLGDTPSEQEDQRYRRWLSGQLDATADERRRWTRRTEEEKGAGNA